MLSKKPLTNIAASIQTKLTNLAKEKGEVFNNLLIRYINERLLYRLSQSQHKQQFILKGATVFNIWNGEPHRPTKDLDFLSFGANEIVNIETVFKDICLIECPEDGVIFLEESVKGIVIKEDQLYEGVRVKLRGKLGSSLSYLQVDIGFGDAVTPNAKEEIINTILDVPKPVLRIYPRETVISEKFQAMVHLGIKNSRMKDFYDIWFLCKNFGFNGDLLSQAITRTFEQRQTAIPAIEPFALTNEFVYDPDKQKQWQGFLNNKGIQQISFDIIVADIRNFIMAPCLASSKNETFDKVWQSPHWK